ncbi:hypothetical protein [Kineosporia sp. NBRC 101677]|uniref:hypothetical protein n=1 Tax=Kineosporia sp. NBRC 101677 TaxID=3032197 RepID=UPI0025559EFD|nr:hypothetical protein [Kineosporia sp. NBRC 101677]
MEAKSRKRYTVTVEGIDLVVENAENREQARFFQDGEQLPRDRWGNTLLVGADGVRHRIEVSYSMRQLSPTVQVDDRPEGIPLVTFSTWGRRIWLVMVVLGAFGLLFQAPVLGFGVMGAGGLLRHSARDRNDFVKAVALVVVAGVLQALWWVFVRNPFSS